MMRASCSHAVKSQFVRADRRTQFRTSNAPRGWTPDIRSNICNFLAWRICCRAMTKSPRWCFANGYCWRAKPIAGVGAGRIINLLNQAAVFRIICRFCLGSKTDRVIGAVWRLRLKNRHSAGEPGRGVFDFERKARDGEPGVGQLVQIGHFFDLAIAGDHACTVAFPDD